MIARSKSSESQIQVIVAMKNESDTPVFGFETTEAAAGFIEDIFEKFGKSVAVSVTVDNEPVEWKLENGDLVIDGTMPKLH